MRPNIALRSTLTLALACALVSGCATHTPAATRAPEANAAESAALGPLTEKPPFVIERLSRPGPLAGVVVRVDLRDTRIATRVALTDDRDPDGAGPCTGQLDTTSAAARKYDFALTLNASFFGAPRQRDVWGRNIRYYSGNCTMPLGWHVQQGRIITKPDGDKLTATMLVHEDGRVSLHDKLLTLPPHTAYAVSGNAMVLKAGQVVSQDAAGARHPRSVVGLSQDGNTLWLVAVDGRQEGWSRGASMRELGELMRDLGAYEAINLDGGGSTALVVKDLGTGTFAVANRPSESSTEGYPVNHERPVADVIGIVFTPRSVK
jgi:hypothetical protein